MRNQAICTILDSLFGVAEIPAALVTQSVQRAVAEQTVEIIPVCFMAREILTIPVLKIRMVILFHERYLLAHASGFKTRQIKSITP